MSVFGQILSPAVVEDWIIDLATKPDETTGGTLFQEYLAEIERQRGKEAQFYAPLADAVKSNEFDYWPEDHLPCLLVMNTGTAEEPVRRGDGKWTATWLIGCAIITSGPTRTEARDAALDYGAAFKAMVLQNRSLKHGDLVEGITWVDERPALLRGDPDSDQAQQAFQMLFSVTVKDIADERGSIPESHPREDPYEEPGPPPVVEEAGATVTIHSQGSVQP